MRMKDFVAIAFSGVLWFVVGLFLLIKGLNFIVLSAHEISSSAILLPSISPLFGGKEQAALILIALGLVAGFVKGRLILSKTVKRVVGRILSMKSPVPIHQIYSWRYGLILMAMVGLGMSMKWFHVPVDIRGFVDVAVGSALMNGALMYFRYAISTRNQNSNI